jgi:hypothetical protein
MNNTGVIINGLPLFVPGLMIRNFKDDPNLILPREDGMRRLKEEVTCITLHSTLGAPDHDLKHEQTLLPGNGPSSDAGRALVEMWGTDHRCAGAHAAIDFDRMIYCLADLLVTETYNATSVNPRNIGIEYRQGRALSEFYQGQLEAGAEFVRWLCIYFGIQLMIPKGYHNRPIQRLVDGAKDFYGVFGHRDQSNNRGAGDPGDFIMDSIRKIGAEEFDLDAHQDRDVWAKRQTWLGMSAPNIDGIPGVKTRMYIQALGAPGGIWAFLPPNVQPPASLRAA